MDRLKNELKEVNLKLDYFYMLEKDPQKLFKKGISCLHNNKFAIWKTLGNILGAKWYHQVILKRTGEDAEDFAINYNPIDDILSEHIKAAVKM